MKALKNMLLAAGAMALLATACTTQQKELTQSGLDPARFDTLINDKPVKLFVLKNKTAEVCITNFGCLVL